MYTNTVHLKLMQCSRPGFHPWVGKIPWRRAWEPLQYPCLETHHGQRSLAGYSPRGSQSAGHNWATQHGTKLWYTPFIYFFMDWWILILVRNFDYFNSHIDSDSANQSPFRLAIVSLLPVSFIFWIFPYCIVQDVLGLLYTFPASSLELALSPGNLGETAEPWFF